VTARRWIAAVLGLLFLATILFPFALRWWIDRRFRRQIYVLEDVPPRQVAIVFGAGITADGRPMPALADRVWTAAQLYHAGKVQKLLMSGDNRYVDYNETEAIQSA
jgi:vancomycin permeability regulator SanA